MNKTLNDFIALIGKLTEAYDKKLVIKKISFKSGKKLRDISIIENNITVSGFFFITDGKNIKRELASVWDLDEVIL
jgi:hypothetical protein